MEVHRAHETNPYMCRHGENKKYNIMAKRSELHSNDMPTLCDVEDLLKLFLSVGLKKEGNIRVPAGCWELRWSGLLFSYVESLSQ